MNLNLRSIGIALVVCLAAVAFVVAFRYRGDLISGRRRLADIPSQVYPSKYGDIEYYLAGEGPTVLISHGVTGGVDQGLGLARTSLGDGYRLLLVSRFGYLKSAMPAEPSAKLQAAAYAELLDYLSIDRVYIFGNSAGATSAYHFANDYAERCNGLILLSANVPGDAGGLPPKPVIRAVFGSDFLYWSTVKAASGVLLGMFVPKAILTTLPASQRRTLADEVLLSGLPMSQRTDGVLFDMFTSNPSINDGVDFTGIKPATLIIHAVDDPAPPIEGARRIASLIPNARLVSFEKGGHLMIGHDEEVRQAIHDFISAQETR